MISATELGLSESKIQSECVKWAWNKHPETRGLICEVNNNPLNAVDGSKRKAMGMVKGHSDLNFYWKGKVYFIEMKDAKGRQSKEQKAWEATVAQQGFNYFIIRDLCSFQELIHNIMTYGVV